MFAVLTAATCAAAGDEASLPPTLADVSYGPHPMNVMDVWLAEGSSPRPLLVYIHGGGWFHGDKKQSPEHIQPYLDHGISYAAINYRLTDEAPLPAPVLDAARAIQFIRTMAGEWNVDAKRVALIGRSAGGCTSMWLLLHDDLADPQSDDPVGRQSTRVVAAAAAAGQTSIDPKVIEGWVGPEVLLHRMIYMAVGEPSREAALANYDSHRDLYVEFSPYNHLTADDPPLFMTYGNNMALPAVNAAQAIHHPVFGIKMKEKADRIGHECHLLIEGVSRSPEYDDAQDFLVRKLLEE